jgi:replicative DNA helicase
LLEDVGGSAYLGRILNTVPTAAHGEQYAGVVRDLAVRRRLITVGTEAVRAAQTPRAGITGAEQARKYADAFALIAATGTTDQFRRVGEVADDVLEAKLSGTNPRIQTGLTYLDGAMGGLPIGGFTLVGGRPGSGKSLLCKQFLLNAGQRGEPVGLVTVEESAEKVAENAISNLASVENNHITYNRLNRGEWDDILRITPDLAKIDLWINDTPVLLGDVESAITCAAVKHKCKLVVVDYLQLIDPGDGRENENSEITKISRTLKAAAKRLDIALVAACQLNRGNETGHNVRKPTLRDLRGSGSLEQDGDTILLLHREDYYHYQDPNYQPTHQLEVIVAKNKAGCNGLVPVKFSGTHQRVTDWEVNDPFGGMGRSSDMENHL